MSQTNLSQSMTPYGSIVGFVCEMNVLASCVNTDAAVVVVSPSKLQSAVSRLNALTQLLSLIWQPVASLEDIPAVKLRWSWMEVFL